ncbi:MAG: U32 family peptidase [Treponema sp.]|nr:U32 family peptidase [Treponema sp.]
MELLSPAGNVEKLSYAYAYGADAAYIGLKKFSLRVKADNFYDDEYKKVIELKNKYPGKKLHCALNISFHNKDIENLKANIDYFRQYPIDAFIVQDIGIVPILQKEFPNAQLHVSTQASCINYEAVKMYKSMGFSRVVLGREASLKEIREIKDAVPDMELEAFCHGAMCIAYAGRCLMSSYLTGRSAQAGLCSHTCRWEYDLLSKPEGAKELAQSGRLYLREHERPEELFPVFEGEDYTAILSSKDIRMVEHLKDMIDAGLDSLKIEGRMKSVYYVALVTRAYRKALDAIEGKITQEEANPFIDELENVAHRESTTGFYYSRVDADKTCIGASDSKYILTAEVGDEIAGADFDSVLNLASETHKNFMKELDEMHPQAREARLKDFEIHTDRKIIPLEKKEGWNLYACTAVNKFSTDMEIEFVSPEFVSKKAKPGEWLLVNPENGCLLNWVCDSHPCLIYTSIKLPAMTLIRIEDPDYTTGIIRDKGR